MGVPKFFRYISERYPCLSELAREHSIPEFDNLYLDMNGIVHNCSHPDDSNIHFHLEESQIFQDIFNYIDKLFYLIKPQKLFFLAVDGVAPRAKMNQQRSRRFRSAREAEQTEAKALQRGEKREHERFDSNCITPGTEFMDRLQRGLRNFLRMKISSDPLWQKCRVILSGQETPGEGEHKIMDYIRFMKAQPKFDPNTRHCLYGLDADLIILGLCTHELHFVVLREEVKFGKNVKRTAVEETRFFLLHLGLLREYLELEFNELSTPEQPLDVAQLIDDWVLMGFMVGNDFIPHLPCLHISSNALPLLYKTYIKIFHKLGGNINEHGKLNLTRLELFMNALSDVELELFEEHFDDLKYMNAKTEAFDVDVSELLTPNVNDDLSALIDETAKLYDSDSEEELTAEGALKREFENYKRNYYRNKFKSELHEDLKSELAYHYVTAVQWVLDYYYRGVQSWDWYYPFHYSPFISDLTQIKDIKVNFQLGKPFLPFQQLLAVLPAASCKLLPEAYHELMLNAQSPLAEFYPQDFESDLNGKKHDWEAVVLIPFIDERRLLDAMKTCETLLSSAERARNRHGPMFQYDYSALSQGSLPALAPLKALQHVFCTEMERWAKEIALNLPFSVCMELPNAARHVFFPGFPTMKHLAFDYELRHGRIRVFEQPSRNLSMVLLPKKRALPDTLTAVASQYLEQVVHIGWPHLIKAKVESVATRSQIVSKEGIVNNESRHFEMDCKSLDEHFTGRMGIKFHNYDVLLYIRTYAGSSVEFGQRGDVYMKDAWSTAVTAYPAQGVVSDIDVRDNMRQHFSKIEELFPVGSTIFFIGTPYFGSEGTVLDPQLVYSCGRIQISIKVGAEPDLEAARILQQQRDREYMNSYDVCRQLDINNKCLGRLTGTVWVVLGPRRERMENVAKHNIGLQLKYPRLNEERAGYCRRINNQWYYSAIAVNLMFEYCENFPEVINNFATSNDRGDYIYEEDIYPNEVGQQRIENLSNWVRQQPHMKVDRITCGSRTVCKDTVELLLTATDELRNKPVKNVKLQVKPHLLIKPNVTLPEVYKSPDPIRLFDRVVVVRTIYMVPVGVTGTVIGVHPVSDPNPVRLECLNAVETFCEILFDKCVSNCGDIHGIAEERVYKVPESALAVIESNEETDKTRQTPNASGRQSQSQSSSQSGYSTRRDRREQQQSRYMTAAGSRYNPITMKTCIADEFVQPDADKAATSKPKMQPQPRPQQQPQQKWRQYDQPMRRQEEQPRRQEQQPRQQEQQPRRQEQPRQVIVPAMTPKQVAPPATAVAADTPQAQTLALQQLLGLSQPKLAVSQNTDPQLHQQAMLAAAIANVPSMINSPLPSQMPKLPQPPPSWRDEAKQHQAKMQQQKQEKQQRKPQHKQHQEQQQNPNYSNSNNNRQQQYEPSAQRNSGGASTSSHTTTIQDFVPTQAYRPKKSQQRNAQPNAQMESVKVQHKLEVKLPPATATAVPAATLSSDAASCELMRTLKITPTTMAPSTSAANATAEAAGTSTQQKPTRKPRVPRIGAKFDLEYILP
ncbi:5'-3' exoribonuclease 1 [Drosophila busckii]|uniref:5'-3' exoribonuclease 1 n=1 Tax=Drosophila busckii TaxID=30019 RepID=UPI0014333759|nr:5'-3' exoribonuclease 1 [Drosophila busckii]